MTKTLYIKIDNHHSRYELFNAIANVLAADPAFKEVAHKLIEDDGRPTQIAIQCLRKALEGSRQEPVPVGEFAYVREDALEELNSVRRKLHIAEGGSETDFVPSIPQAYGVDHTVVAISDKLDTHPYPAPLHDLIP